MNNKVIEVKNLVKRYKSSQENAVNDISFDVEKGEFFTLLGPNGAGKTTVMSILTTILSHTSGEATVASFNVEQQAQEVRNKIGIIFQNPSLDLNLTAEENIRFHAVLYHEYSYTPMYQLMPQSYKDRVNELADLVGLQDVLNKPVKTYSGGMKRKLEIVRSLMHHPEILFLDEPTTGLDPASRKNVWEYINRVKEESGTTVFLTTHYLEEAEKADTICILMEGEISTMGSPAEIKKNLLKERVYLEAQDIKTLGKKLKEMDISYKTEGKSLVVGMNGGLSAQELIKRLDVKLDKLVVENPTLEEAYLDIIMEEIKEDETK